MGFLSTLKTIGGAVAPVLSAVTGIGQTFLDAKQSRTNTDKTIEANKKMAEYQYSKDLEMWNRANEYNSPQSQMKRLTDAKLNPNLVYGQGAVANSTSQLPKYNAPTQNFNYQAPQVLDKLGTYLDLQIRQQQSRKLEEEIRGQQLNNALAADSNYYKTGNLYEDWERKKISNSLATWDKEMKEPFYAGGHMAHNFAEMLKATVLKNSLMDQQKLNYQSQYAGQMLTNDIRQLEKKWYSTAGIKGANDLIPWIKMLFKK